MTLKFPKIRYFFGLALLAAAAMLLSACTGGSLVNTWGNIATDGQNVYLANQNEVFALKAVDGSLVWRYPPKVDIATSFYARPALADGLVVVPDYTNVVHFIDPATGNVKAVFDQQKSQGHMPGGAAIAGDLTLVGSSNRFLFALGSNATLKWKFEAKNGIWATPVADSTQAYVAGMDHFLYALDLQTGRQIWATDIGSAQVGGPLLTAEGNVIAETISGDLWAINPQNGSVVWKQKLEGGVWSTPLLDNGILYVGTDKNKIYAVSADKGSIVWQAAMPSPVIAGAGKLKDNVIFAGENGEVAAYSVDGTAAWTRTITGKLYATPAVAGDLAVFPVTKGENVLVSFDANGNQGWTFVVPKR